MPDSESNSEPGEERSTDRRGVQDHDVDINVPEGVDSEGVVPHYNPDTGAGTAPVPGGEPVDGAVELHGQETAEVHLTTRGIWFDEGEPPRVDVTVITSTADLNLYMSPERAREIAAELRLAATHAEQGDLEVDLESGDDDE